MNSMVDLSIAMLVITRGYAMINHYEPLLIIINHSYAMLCHVMPCCAMLCHGDWDGMFVDILDILVGFKVKCRLRGGVEMGWKLWKFLRSDLLDAFSDWGCRRDSWEPSVP
jgi:hypothetical protein